MSPWSDFEERFKQGTGIKSDFKRKSGFNTTYILTSSILLLVLLGLKLLGTEDRAMISSLVTTE